MNFIRNMLPAALFAVTVFAACTHNQGGKVDKIDAQPAPLVRLDRLVDEVGSIDASDIDALGKYLNIMGLEASDVAAAADTLRQSRMFCIFAPDVEARLGKTEGIEAALGRVNAVLERDLAIAPHSFYGIVSPYRQQVVVADSLVFIALNHYLGADYPGYEGMPAYLRSAKVADRIPADVAEAIVALQFPYKREAGSTVLNRLLYEGALTREAARAAGMDLATFLGWSAAEFDDVACHEGEIWRQMAGRQYIYSADPALEERLVAPQSATSVLSEALPPRVGRFIGARIVEAYLERFPDTDTATLLSPSFYNDPQTLILAQYSPR